MTCMAYSTRESSQKSDLSALHWTRPFLFIAVHFHMIHNYILISICNSSRLKKEWAFLRPSSPSIRYCVQFFLLPACSPFSPITHTACRIFLERVHETNIFVSFASSVHLTLLLIFGKTFPSPRSSPFGTTRTQLLPQCRYNDHKHT